MVTRRRSMLIGLGIVFVLLVITAPADAQSAAVLDDIVTQFQSRAAGWESSLRSFALNTFGILAAIELAWAAFRLAFRGADVSEWLAEIVNQILFLGFFLALLENSVTWGQAIVNSFRQAASTAGGGGIAPSDVFTAGVDLAQKVMSQMSIWSPAASVGLIIAGLVIEVCFALIAACMVLALVESYLVISMGVLFMAFGGTQWTKDLAISTVRYTLSVGAKLFVLQLLVSIGDSLIQSWAATFNDITASSLCILVGCSIVMLALVKVLPETMQRIVNGSSMASGSALVGAAAAVGGATAVFGAGLAGSGAMAGNALRLASTQLDAKDDAGTAPVSRIGRAAALTGYTAKNMLAAPLADVGRRLSGQPGARHGIATWRMSADLGNRRRLLEEDRNKPKPPNESAPAKAGDGNNTIS
jgi:type IV secretion system protein TrbL